MNSLEQEKKLVKKVRELATEVGTKSRGNEKGVWIYVGEVEQRGGVNVWRGRMEGDAQQPYYHPSLRGCVPTLL